MLAVTGQYSVDKPWGETVKQQPKTAFSAGDEKVPAGLNCGRNLAGDVAGGHAGRLGPGEVSLIFQQHLEVLAFSWSGGDEQHIDAEAFEFWADGFAEAMEGELAGRIFGFVGSTAFAEDGAHIYDERIAARAKQGNCLADEFDRREEV